MKNVIFVVIDALSKWYIDQYKSESGFFGKLEKESYCANNMFSGAPFTEGAIRGMWASESTIEGLINPVERQFANDPFQILFRKNGYYLYADEGFRLNIDKEDVADNWNKESIDKMERRILGRIIATKLKYYCDLNETGKFNEKDYWKVEELLVDFFNNVSGIEKVGEERRKFVDNRKAYIDDIVNNMFESSFFCNLSSLDIYKLKKYPLSHGLQKVFDVPLSRVEKEFIMEAKYKNLEFLAQGELANDAGEPKFLEKVLWGDKTNRCLQTNSDLTFTMRDSYEKGIPLRRRFEKFLDWYDSYDHSAGKPFLAYIHSADFHYPASFMNKMWYEEGYEEELKQRITEVKNMKWHKMSVSKQLSLANVERNLEYFWSEMQKRKIFDNSYVILTADHGISNFMLKNPDSTHRWNYTKTNFQVPFYFQGNDVEKRVEDNLRTATDIVPILIEKCGIEKFDNKYVGHLDACEKGQCISTSWINGEPDLDRKKIKMGIRNQNYSVTWEGYVTQFWATGNAIGIYNLTNDPDECFSLEKQWKKSFNDEQLLSVMSELKMRWYEMVKALLLGGGSKWNFGNRYEFLENNRAYYDSLNETMEYMSWEKFSGIVAEKEVVIWGTDEEAVRLLSDSRLNFKIKAIWREESVQRSEEYFWGHEIINPNIATLTDETIIIIANRFEFESVEYLRSNGIKDYLFSRLIV